MKLENLRQLHIIRGFAALYVAIGHAKVVFWSGGRAYLEHYPRQEWGIIDYFIFIIDLLSSSAQEFVIVFFVLSGFFINHSFKKNNWATKGFFINRLVRIVPPYLFSVLFAICVILFIHHFYPTLLSGELTRDINRRMTASFNELNIQSVLLSIVFLPNNDYIACNFAYWSLIHEWFFYFTIPFLLRFANTSTWVFGGLFIIGSVLDTGADNLILDYLLKYGIFFFIGVVFYNYVEKGLWKKSMPNALLCYGITLFSTLATIALGILDLKFPISLVFAALTALLAILTLLKHPIKQIHFLKAGVFLGDISYSLYILHLPFYYLAYAFLTKWTGEYVFFERIYWFMIPLAIAFSYLMYQLVEKRTLAIIKHLKENT